MRIWIAAASAGLFGLGLGAWLMQRLRVRRDSGLARARNARGKRGEARAAELLEQAGYRIVARQRRISYRLLADSREVPVLLSLDFVVERDGCELIAEVKTGAAGTQLRNAETRRQLLEYQLASGAARVLLVDPENERITEVSFPLAGTTPMNAPELPDSRDSHVGAWLFCLVALGLWLWFFMRARG